MRTQSGKLINKVNATCSVVRQLIGISVEFKISRGVQKVQKTHATGLRLLVSGDGLDNVQDPSPRCSWKLLL